MAQDDPPTLNPHLSPDEVIRDLAERTRERPRTRSNYVPNSADRSKTRSKGKTVGTTGTVYVAPPPVVPLPTPSKPKFRIPDESQEEYQNLLDVSGNINRDTDNLGNYVIEGIDTSITGFTYHPKLTGNRSAEHVVVKAIQGLPGVSPSGNISWYPQDQLFSDAPKTAEVLATRISKLEEEISQKATIALFASEVQGKIQETIRASLLAQVSRFDRRFSSEFLTNLSKTLSYEVANRVATIYQTALEHNPDSPDVVAKEAYAELHKFVEASFVAESAVKSDFKLGVGGIQEKVTHALTDYYGKGILQKDIDGNDPFLALQRNYTNASWTAINTAVFAGRRGGTSNLEISHATQVQAQYATDGSLHFYERGMYFYGPNGRAYFGDFSDKNYQLVVADERGRTEAVSEALTQASKDFKAEYGRTIQAQELSKLVSNLWRGDLERVITELLVPLPKRGEKTDFEKEIDKWTTTNGFSKAEKKKFKGWVKDNLGVAVGLYERPTRKNLQTGELERSKHAVAIPYVYLSKQLSKGRRGFGVARGGIYSGALGFALGGPAGGIIGSVAGWIFGGVAEYGIKKYADKNTEIWKAREQSIIADSAKKAVAYAEGREVFSSNFSEQLDLLKSREFAMRFNRKKVGRKKEERDDYSSTLMLIASLGGTLVSVIAKSALRHAFKIPYHQTVSDWWRMEESLSKYGAAMQNLRFGGQLAGAGFKAIPGGAIGGVYSYLVSGGNIPLTIVSALGSWGGGIFNRLIETQNGFAQSGRMIGSVFREEQALLKFGDVGFVRYGNLARFGNWIYTHGVVGVNGGKWSGWIYDTGITINKLHISYKGALLGNLVGRALGHSGSQLLLDSAFGYVGESALYWAKGLAQAGWGWFKSWLPKALAGNFWKWVGGLPKGSFFANEVGWRTFFKYFGEYGKYLKGVGLGGLAGYGLGHLLGRIFGWDPALTNAASMYLVAPGAAGGVGLQILLKKFGGWGGIFGKIFNVWYGITSVINLPRSAKDTAEGLVRIPVEGATPQNLITLLGNAFSTYWGYFTATGLYLGIRQWFMGLKSSGVGGTPSISLGKALLQGFGNPGAVASAMFTAFSVGIRMFMLELGGLVTTMLSSAVIGIIGTGLFVVVVIGAAVFMVTVAQNRANPPASTKITVSKTMVVNGDNIRATVVLTNISTEPITIWSVKDNFYYVPNTATCTETKQEVTHSNGFGYFNYDYDVTPAHASALCDVQTCVNCESLSRFPGSVSGTICNNLLDPWEQRVFQFELKGFKGSSANDSTAMGTYLNEVTVSATESLGKIENAYATAKLDIGGANLCMAKFEAPCGCPLSLTNPGACAGANITQECGGSFSHQGLEAVDIATADGTTIYTPISGTLTRWVKTVQHCDPADYGPGVCNGFGLGVYLIVENSSYKVIIGHLKATADDVAMFHAACDPDPYCGIPVQVGVATQVSRGAGIAFADNTGYSTNSHIHYEVKKMPENFPICPNNYDGGSLLDYSSAVCQGVPPL